MSLAVLLARVVAQAVLPVCLLLSTSPGRAAEPPLREVRVLPDEQPLQCMAASEFSLAGLRLGDPLEKLGTTMGVPRTLTSGYGEDDGGGYRAYIYEYRSLSVVVVRNVVDVIHTNGGMFTTPSGLRVGLTREEAWAVLGGEPDPEYHDNGVYSFSGCPETRGDNQIWYDSWYFEFAFGEDGRLSHIRFVTDRP